MGGLKRLLLCGSSTMGQRLRTAPYSSVKEVKYSINHFPCRTTLDNWQPLLQLVCCVDNTTLNLHYVENLT